MNTNVKTALSFVSGMTIGTVTTVVLLFYGVDQLISLLAFYATLMAAVAAYWSAVAADKAVKTHQFNFHPMLKIDTVNWFSIETDTEVTVLYNISFKNIGNGIALSPSLETKEGFVRKRLLGEPSMWEEGFDMFNGVNRSVEVGALIEYSHKFNVTEMNHFSKYDELLLSSIIKDTIEYYDAFGNRFETNFTIGIFDAEVYIKNAVTLGKVLDEEIKYFNATALSRCTFGS